MMMIVVVILVIVMVVVVFMIRILPINTEANRRADLSVNVLLLCAMFDALNKRTPSKTR